MSEDNSTLDSFLEYCKAHPRERFWQALRNWSGNDYVLIGNLSAKLGRRDYAVVDGVRMYVQDTFYLPD